MSFCLSTDLLISFRLALKLESRKIENFHYDGIYIYIFSQKLITPVYTECYGREVWYRLVLFRPNFRLLPVTLLPAAHSKQHHSHARPTRSLSIHSCHNIVIILTQNTNTTLPVWLLIVHVLNWTYNIVIIRITMNLVQKIAMISIVIISLYIVSIWITLQIRYTLNHVSRFIYHLYHLSFTQKLNCNAVL